MLTGTPLDLTPFGAVLTGIGWLYWLLAATCIWWATRGRRPLKSKLLRALPVALAFVLIPGVSAWQRLVAASRLDKAMARFGERCKTAGEKITRAVDNVDGVVWMKWRGPDSNRSDQFKLDDPYGYDCAGEECIANLLRVTAGETLRPDETKRRARGFRFIESADPNDGQRSRYVGVLKQGWNPEAIERHKKETGEEPPGYSYQFKVERVPIDAFTARYGVTWDDISTHEDREQWIAGGSLKVIDLQTNEVIGERVGYMIDRGLGSRAGFRSPWGFAVQTACPSFAKEPSSGGLAHIRMLSETREFITRVLRPKAGE